MFYIPAGVMATANENYVAKAQELYGITAEQIAGLNVAGVVHNLVPVTLGNIIGGVVCVGMMYYLIHVKEWKKK